MHSRTQPLSAPLEGSGALLLHAFYVPHTCDRDAEVGADGEDLSVGPRDQHLRDEQVLNRQDHAVLALEPDAGTAVQTTYAALSTDFLSLRGAWDDSPRLHRLDRIFYLEQPSIRAEGGWRQVIA